MSMARVTGDAECVDVRLERADPADEGSDFIRNDFTFGGRKSNGSSVRGQQAGGSVHRHFG